MGFHHQNIKNDMRKALLLVDLQNDYFPGGKMPLDGANEAVHNARLLLDRFRNEFWPVYHIRHVAMKPEATFFLPGTAGSRIHPNVNPLAGENVITKNYPNAFRDTDLLHLLKKIDVQELVICGMMTHMCIDATTRAAKDSGYNCTVIGDACATKALEINGQVISSENVHLSFLGALAAYYSGVCTTEEFLNKNL
jgi:nicotinamidase-related amidase